ncbi:hypothetical protein Scep_001341 [Stephania cephalantha]|uniref:Uncharacterized protein n=1 Tax=Stephania cephalantha TaxID=152367 RepID=A0AAP0Q3P4_9MAGN
MVAVKRGDDGDGRSEMKKRTERDEERGREQTTTARKIDDETHPSTTLLATGDCPLCHPRPPFTPPFNLLYYSSAGFSTSATLDQFLALSPVSSTSSLPSTSSPPPRRRLLGKPSSPPALPLKPRLRFQLLTFLASSPSSPSAPSRLLPFLASCPSALKNPGLTERLELLICVSLYACVAL